MEKNKVQNDKVQPNDEISDKDLDKVAGGRFRQDTMESVGVAELRELTTSEFGGHNTN